MRNGERFGDTAGVVDVLAGAAASLPARRRAMVIELQRDADDVVPLALHEGGGDRGIDAPRHGNDDALAARAVCGRDWRWGGAGGCGQAG